MKSHSFCIYIVGVGKGVVVVYYYLNIFHICMHLGSDSDISKSDVPINQHCLCLIVLPVGFSPSSLPLVHIGEISVLRL